MARRVKYGNDKRVDTPRKKTRQGQGKFSKHGDPGPHGGNKGYRKKSRGQGK